MTDAPRLIALDLDGTLLSTDGTVSARNRAALQRATAAGARVVAATGRSGRWLRHLGQDLPPSVAVCCNGGVVVDTVDGTTLEAHPLDADAMREALVLLRRTGLDFTVAVERVDAEALAAEEAFPDRGKFAAVQRAPLDRLCTGDVVKVLFRTGEGRTLVDFFAADYGRLFTLTRSTGDGLIEASLAGITKGSVVAGLAASWGIPAGQAVAFGDMPNDVAMIRWAGVGVAMGNADPELLAIADEVTGHHDEDGVAEVLERWF